MTIDTDPSDGEGPATTNAAEIKINDGDLEMLQEILVGSYRRNADDLEQEVNILQAEIAELNRTINDKQTLIDTLSPIVASSIHQSIIDSQEEMTEALYPIMGRLVTRAVSEAMRDLVHRIDTQMRRTFSFGSVARQIKARSQGVSEAELALREALPFQVCDLFLIHRESGILLQHISGAPENQTDSDLISGMLTAIRDFVQDAFGQNNESDLDQIQYGETTILIETAQSVYLAAVITGFPPQNFRVDMRQLIYAIDLQFGPALHDFDGDASRFDETRLPLETLLQTSTPASDHPPTPVKEQSSTRKNLRLIIGVAAIIIGVVIIGWMLWQLIITGALGAAT